MPKDIIFDNKPKEKKISKSHSACPYDSSYIVPENKRFFPASEIDLADYRVIGKTEFLRQGDIYWNGRLFETTYLTKGNNKPPPHTRYYRKKSTQKNEDKSFASSLKEFNDKYEILLSTEKLEEGDEFYNVGDNKWHKISTIGRMAGSAYCYRRLRQTFTEKELEEAKKYYKINNVPLF